MTWAWSTLVAAVVLVPALSGCGAGDESDSGASPSSETSSSTSTPSTAAATFNLSGTVTITDLGGYYNQGNYPGAFCTGDSGYEDIREGAQVVVRDADGTQVAVGELGPGSMTGNPRKDLTAGCAFPLMVFGVPDGSSIYSIEVSHRGELSYKRAELDGPLDLTIG